MATYSELLTSFDTVFASNEWALESINTFPANFYPNNLPDEFIKYEVLPAGKGEQEYGEVNYKAGLFIAQIYTQANRGPKRIYELASAIETQFSRSFLGSTQTYDGTLTIVGIDKDDTSLFRADYSLTFNSF